MTAAVDLPAAAENTTPGLPAPTVEELAAALADDDACGQFLIRLARLELNGLIGELVVDAGLALVTPDDMAGEDRDSAWETLLDAVREQSDARVDAAIGELLTGEQVTP